MLLKALRNWNKVQKIIWLLLIVTCDNVVALKLNLTETCSGTQLRNCVLLNISASYTDPLSLANSTQTELNQLVIRNAIILRMPRDLFNQAPNLKSFMMHDCSLTRIDSYEFEKAKQLRMLMFQRNRLSTIPEKIFIYLSSLEELFLDANTIHTVHNSAFVGLSRLRTLDLQQNAIRELPEHLFADLINLEYIDLSNNRIDKIDSSTFFANLKLKTVILNNNRFTVFEPDSLYHINQLNFLDVSNCKLDELNTQAVNELFIQNSELKSLNVYGSVQKIHAGSNHLSSINISDKVSIYHLELHGNSFQSLDDFVGMTNLQYLDISKNHITSLKTEKSPIFLPLHSLIHLNLAFNHLKNLSSDNFLLLRKLTYLDLALNNFVTLDTNIFKPLHVLEKLFIDGNNLRTFEYRNFFMDHNYLKEIGMYSNAWDYHFLREMSSFFNEHSVQIVKRFFEGAGTHSANSSSTSNSYHHYLTSETIPISRETSSSGTMESQAGDTLAIATLIMVFILLVLQVLRLFRDEHNNLNYFCCFGGGDVLREDSHLGRRQRFHDEETSEV